MRQVMLPATDGIPYRPILLLDFSGQLYPLGLSKDL